VQINDAADQSPRHVRLPYRCAGRPTCLGCGMPFGWVWLAAAAVIVSSILPRAAVAQTFFYNEVAKDDRIYVFSSSPGYDAFVESGGAVIGPVIERPGYGPSGETVVFDSENAVNLYNFKHGLPGETFPASKELHKSDFPSHKVSGLMFGDYYWYYQRHQDNVSSTNPTPVEGQHGLWFRRIYLTYDFAQSEKISVRFRLEANSNGDFEGGDIVPYVKDASIKWTYKGKQQLTLGIQPTLTFDWLEGFWGLRHIEKTPADLYRLDSSRDMGFSFAGPARIRGLSYAAQFGNESGSGSETREGKILRFQTRYEPTSAIGVEGFYSFGRGPSGQNRQTGQGFAGFRSKAVRAGLQYLWHERMSGEDAVPDQTIAVWSGFLVWDIVPKKGDLFIRADSVKGHLGGVETGLPGAEAIDYWILSSQSPFVTWIAGGEWYLHAAVRFSPNLELVRYAHDPDPTQLPGRRQDSILRFTFFWTF
jgi:hypothetical protein